LCAALGSQSAGILWPLTAVFHEREMEMKHIKKVTKDARPMPAYVWEWPGIAKAAGKPWYVDALFNSDGTLDPNNVENIGLFLD
jgi:hypothetical protein